MHALRSFTDNADVVWRFLQSVNCIFYQLQWLESNLRTASNTTLAIVVLVVCLLGYITFACSGSSEGDGYFCGSGGVPSLLVAALVCSMIYFLYKRLTSGGQQNSASQPADEEEREKFIHATVPPFDQITRDGDLMPKRYSGQSIV
jgi:hypothetical protein